MPKLLARDGLVSTVLYHEPTGAGKGGDEYVAATRLMASIHSFIS